jgi:hypothetical protein
MTTYVASITFTARNGAQGRRQFLVYSPADILKCGMWQARSVGGNNVVVKGWYAQGN